MMHCAPATLLLVPFEHREIDDPQWPPSGGCVAFFVPDLQAQRAERIGHDLGLVRAEKNQVTVLRCAALEYLRQHLGREKLDDRRLQPVWQVRLVVDLYVRE